MNAMKKYAKIMKRSTQNRSSSLKLIRYNLILIFIMTENNTKKTNVKIIRNS